MPGAVIQCKPEAVPEHAFARDALVVDMADRTLWIVTLELSGQVAHGTLFLIATLFELCKASKSLLGRRGESPTVLYRDMCTAPCERAEIKEHEIR